MRFKFSFLLFPLSLLCFGLIGCNSHSLDPADTTVASPPSPPAYFNITKDTVIVRSDLNDEHVEAAQALRDGLEEILGYRLAFSNDSDAPFSSEILIGTTNRDCAQSFYADITALDHGFAVLNETTLAIAGGTGASSLTAVESFLASYQKDTPFLVGTVDIDKYSYPITALTLAGKPLTDFTVLYDRGTDFRNAAKTLVTKIETLTGTRLPIASRSQGAETPHTIRIELDATMGAFGSAYGTVGNDFVIRAANERIEAAVLAFTAQIFPENAKGKLDVPATDGIVEAFSFASDEYYKLEYQNTTEQIKVCPGVTRYTRHYLDRSGAPVKAYVIECAPGSVKPVLGTTDGAYKITYQQSVLTQLSYEERNTGLDFCAAINGCLYEWSKELNAFRAWGLLVKNGQIINDYATGTYQAFGVKKDGSYYFGTPGSGDINYSDLETCVSGAFLLLKDGAPYDLGLSWPDLSFSKTRHPRTGIGVKADGTLFFIVVDGRQKSHSNGATLADFALIFRELGCTDAVNIDGGGSSISYTKDYHTGEYIMWNSPSDGSPRAVLNCLLIARNEDYQE